MKIKVYENKKNNAIIYLLFFYQIVERIYVSLKKHTRKYI